MLRPVKKKSCDLNPSYFLNLTFTHIGIKGQKGQLGDPGQGLPGLDGHQGPRGKMCLNAVCTSSSI